MVKYLFCCARASVPLRKLNLVHYPHSGCIDIVPTTKTDGTTQTHDVLGSMQRFPYDVVDLSIYTPNARKFARGIPQRKRPWRRYMGRFGVCHLDQLVLSHLPCENPPECVCVCKCLYRHIMPIFVL